MVYRLDIKNQKTAKRKAHSMTVCACVIKLLSLVGVKFFAVHIYTQSAVFGKFIESEREEERQNDDRLWKAT